MTTSRGYSLPGPCTDGRRALHRARHHRAALWARKRRMEASPTAEDIATLCASARQGAPQCLLLSLRRQMDLDLVLSGRREQFLDVGRGRSGCLRRLARFGDEALEPAWDRQLKAAQRRVAGHLEAVDDAAREEDERPWPGFPAPVATGDRYRPFENEEGLVLRMVGVRRRGKPRRSRPLQQSESAPSLLGASLHRHQRLEEADSMSVPQTQHIPSTGSHLSHRRPLSWPLGARSGDLARLLIN